MATRKGKSVHYTENVSSQVNSCESAPGLQITVKIGSQIRGQ